MIENNDEAKRSKIWTVVTSVTSVLITIPASGEGKDIEVPMTYTMNKESKTISIQQDDAQIQKIAEKSDGQYTTETLKNAVQSIGTTFEYSIDDGTLTLTEREYGEQMMFNKN